MWNKSYAMLWLANLLYTLAGLLALYCALYFAIRLPWFELKTVQVRGELTHASQEQLLAVVRGLKGNFFTVDLDEARSRFEKLPWVRGVGLRRQWPDRLEVALEEQVPVARWSNGGLVNTYGEVYAAEADADLPLFSGPAGTSQDIAKAYAAFKQMLEPIQRVPVQVRMTTRRAWQIQLDDGSTLALGRERMDARLKRFVAAYDRTLGGLQWQSDYVDLRYDNGFALRVPEAVREQSEPAKREKHKAA
ncbi:MAG TPA: cell division protein FtsQ/DivIB [Burkholderiales bacterium]|nr:cell division protein FtsQ/DivIB [Burkholderiales bacterium]